MFFFSFAFQGNVMRKMSSLSLPQLRLPSSVRTRFWRKKSVTISDLDPQYRVTYLGNVLTGWAKGKKLCIIAFSTTVCLANIIASVYGSIVPTLKTFIN